MSERIASWDDMASLIPVALSREDWGIIIGLAWQTANGLENGSKAHRELLEKVSRAVQIVP